MTQELVVLLDDEGRSIGTEAKATVHHSATPLHLAFSSYVVDDRGRVLLTQRAFGKPTWPGVWTNSCCGHPLPGEAIEDAVVRRLSDELGISDVKAELVLPGFRYRAEMPNGVVENEVCPVYRVRWSGAPEPASDEVAAYRWIEWSEIRAVDGLSPWAELQLDELDRLGPAPADWETADENLLPPAARP